MRKDLSQNTHNITMINDYRKNSKNIYTAMLLATIFVLTIILGVSTRIDKNQDVEFERAMRCFSPNEYSFSPKMQKVSSFSTDFSTSTSARKHNIKLASESFSWIVVKSHHTLSFNNIVGKRTQENGYENAKVILNGEYIEGVGGGVCQVSTTLYNAWLRANLGTEYVQAHSLPSSYCELSQDATVSEYIDLVLVNTSQYDVIVNGYTNSDKIYFDIYANPFNFDINVRTELVQTIDPSPIEVQEVDEFDEKYKDLIQTDERGEYVLTKRPRQGYKSRAYLEYYDKQGKLVEEKLIREDYYKPQQGVMLRKKQVLLPQDYPQTLPWFGDMQE